MDDLIYIVMFILFVVAPLLERVRKKPGGGTPGTGVPPGTPESEAGRPERPREAPARVGSGGVPGRASDGAGSVIPDDLWELLTGERRRPPPQPGEEPTYEKPQVESYDEDAIAAAGTTYGDEWEPEPPPELVVTRPLPTPAERLAALSPEKQGSGRSRGKVSAPIELELVARRRARLPIELGNADELRRAVVLREILGPPRGLE